MLSIVILNYNTGKYLKNCISSILKSHTNYNYEIICIDNHSTDASFDTSYSFFRKYKNIIWKKLPKNLGFATGNNQAKKLISSDTDYILFLNPDTVVKKNTLQKSLDFCFKKNIDAMTCKIILAKTGKIQNECHRGFPTPWRSFCYFSGLSKIFPRSKLFSGYFLGHLSKTKIHPIDACVGAFFMIKKTVMDKIGWWNENYFFYGEDLDLCFQLHKNNFKLYFYPYCSIIHFQGISSGIIGLSKTRSTASRQTKIRSAKASTDAMMTFYRLNYFNQYSPLTKIFVSVGIYLLSKFRYLKAKYL